MLQVLPAAQRGSEDYQRLSLFAQTLKIDELLTLDNETLLFRLFHEEKCRLFPGESVSFKCECSRERSERALKLLSNNELRDIIAERGSIDIDCQFCNSQYSFDAADVEQICLEKSAKQKTELH